MDERQQNKRLFEEMPVPKALAAMAVPTVISQLMVLIYSMADTFFIGRANNPLMVAGASLILPVYNVCIAFANIAGTGGGTLISRLLGKNKVGDARSAAAFSFWFSLLTGVLYSLLVGIWMRPLLSLLGASGATRGYAEAYASCVIVAGAVPTILSMTLASLLRGSGKAREAGLGTAMGGLINIVLDPLFMFVILPRGNEIVGAGVATALSNVIVCCYFLVVTFLMRSEVLNFSPRFFRLAPEHLKAFFAVGLPGALGPFLFDMDYIVLDRLMAGHGDAALAAIGIVLKAERLPLNVGIGLCLGMVPLAAYSYAAGHLSRMEEILRFTRKTGVAVSVVSIVFYELAAPYLMRIFIADPETVRYGTFFLRSRSPATILMFLSFIYVHFFQAVGKAGYALGLAVMRWLLVNIPMLFLLDALFGVPGLVASQFVSDSIVALVSWLVYRRFRRKEGLVGGSPGP